MSATTYPATEMRSLLRLGWFLLFSGAAPLPFVGSHG